MHVIVSYSYSTVVGWVGLGPVIILTYLLHACVNSILVLYLLAVCESDLERVWNAEYLTI